MRLLALVGLAAAGASALAQSQNLRDAIGIDQLLEAKVPLDARFTDSEGRAVRLGDLFSRGKGVLLVPVFYECKGVCTTILTNVTRSLRSMQAMSVGRDFEVVTISIHPKETPRQAAEAKRDFLQVYNRPGAEKGWHFLVGGLDQIRRVTDAVGYRFLYDPERDAVSHPAGILVLTPDGRVSRYFYGIEFSAKLLMQAIADAGQGRIGRKTEPLFWGCVMYDPKSGKYTLVVDRALKIGGALTLLILGTTIFVLSRRGSVHGAGGGAPGSPA
ncbi:MAG: SCO family protein [Fimbriimonadales bacterium]|nr:SCO family protein [Fimbriimonadales bacterium]